MKPKVAMLRWNLPMQLPRSVIIIHVPYEQHGGEDAHVELLAKAYEAIGVQSVLYPASRKPPLEGRLSAALGSLAKTERSDELESLWLEHGKPLLHLHNIYPTLGPRLLRWIIARGATAVMTVHNHRLYCTNGLALHDGRICKECRHSPSLLRPITRNCNADLKKSAYYAAAITQARKGNLFDKAITRFIAPSPYIKDELVELGYAPEKISQIANPIVGEKTVKADAAIDVLYAGRLSQEKGIVYLLEAARSLSDTRFAIIGGGPLEQEVGDAAAALPNLKYFGAHSHEQTLGFIACAKVGVLPSICNEILPTFVLEAFLQGKRCVVPDQESTRWLAQGDFPGHAAVTNDPIDLVRAIKAALRAPALTLAQTTALRERLGFDRFCVELKMLVSRVCE